MEKVVLLPHVRDEIERLTGILFEKDYFSYPENAIAYTDAIYDFIFNIPHHKRYATKNSRFGSWYCRF